MVSLRHLESEYATATEARYNDFDGTWYRVSTFFLNLNLETKSASLKINRSLAFAIVKLIANTTLLGNPDALKLLCR